MSRLNQEQSSIQSSLNLQNCLGDLYPIFCSYRREDIYSNSNFISDGLDNVQIIERAKQFIEFAQKEIKKASQGKCTITASLYDLLVIPEFKPLVEYFELGNRIRIKVDGKLYTLMLIGFSLNFGDLNTISVTFSSATKVSNEITKDDDIIESAKQMATSYDYVQKQAEKAKEIDTTMKSIVQNGLDSSLVMIKNNENEEVTQGKFGILLRKKDYTTGGYSPKQSRLTHNSMIYTTDGWETARCAFGEHRYTYYNPDSTNKNKFEQAIGYGLTADFIQANTSIFSPQIIAGELYSQDYDKEDGIGSYISLNGKGKFNFGNLLSFDGEKQKLRITAEVSTGSLLNETEIKSSSFKGGYLLIGDEDKKGTYAEITKEGILNCNGANITGTITSSKFKGGYLLIGDENKVNNYAEITSDGVLNCNGGNFTGAITGSSFTAIGSVVKYAKDYTEEDLTIAQEISIRQREYTSDYLEKYDFDGDGVINARDMLKIQKMLIGEIDSVTIDTTLSINKSNSTNILQTTGVSIRPNSIFSKNINCEKMYFNNLYVLDTITGYNGYVEGITGEYEIGDKIVRIIGGIITRVYST